jgi:hypothetical protein
MVAKKKPAKQYIIETDGRTVWINGPYGLLGRFSRQGIDVHVNGRCEGDSCVSERCSLQHWRDFQKKMVQYHKIVVSDEYAPLFIIEVRNAHLATLTACLEGIAQNTRCPDPGNGGCVGGPITGYGCVHEAAVAARKSLDELAQWSKTR